jgi:hypothetical protein
MNSCRRIHFFRRKISRSITVGQPSAFRAARNGALGDADSGDRSPEISNPNSDPPGHGLAWRINSREYGQSLQPDAGVRFGSCADGSELARSHSLFDQTRRLSGVMNAKITRT